MDIFCGMLNIRSRMGEYPENVKNMEISRNIMSQEMLCRNIRRYSESTYAMWAYPENILSYEMLCGHIRRIYSVRKFSVDIL